MWIHEWGDRANADQDEIRQNSPRSKPSLLYLSTRWYFVHPLLKATRAGLPMAFRSFTGIER